MIADVEREKSESRAHQPNAQWPSLPVLAKRECTPDDREEDEALNGVVHVAAPRLQSAQAERRSDRRKQWAGS